MNISSAISKSFKVITREGKPSLISKMTGASIEGNGVTRKMKAAKRASRFYTTVGAVGMPYGMMKATGGAVGMAMGGSIFMGACISICEGINARNAVKALKPEYKQIVDRAKKIYA